MRRVEFNIDPNDPKKGVKTMSLVADPAIQSDFVFFSKEKSKYVELKATGYKQVVAGLALIPEKDILRFDQNGEPYNGFFTAAGIETIRNQFHKQEMTSEVNTDHSSNYVSAYLIESFIVDSPERLADVKAKGIDEATLGSWFVAYKIDDPTTFSKVVAGELKGFSVEIYLNQKFSIQKPKENKLTTLTIELSMNKFLEKFKEVLNEMEQADVTPAAPASEEKPKFERAKTIPDDQLIDYSDVGKPVSVVSVDDAGKEALAPVKAGTYNLDNGKQVIVDEKGNLVSVGDTQLQTKEEPAKEVAPVADFSKENETLKAELANIKTELERLKKTPLAQPTKTIAIKQELSNYELEKMLPADRMRAKYGF